MTPMNSISAEDVLDRFPTLPVDHDTKAYWAGCLEKKLMINRCDDCGYYIHKPRPRCPRCWSKSVTPTEVSGKGTIYLLSFWHQTRNPAERLAAPIPAVAVELIEQPGLRLTTTIVDTPNEDIRIGLPVVLTWVEWSGGFVPAFRVERGATHQI